MDPTTFDTEWEGCIYADHPSNPHYQLTPDELRSMQFEGLPIRVEHDDGQDVGRVLSAQVTPDGRAYVKAALFNTPAGWACHTLMKEGDLSQLSLKHGIFADGSLQAMEVSLVKEGARPRTDIYPNTKKKSVSAAPRYLGGAGRGDAGTSVMASAGEAAASFPPAAEGAPNAAAADAAAVVAEKRKRDEETGRFVGAGEPAAKEARSSLPGVLESVAGLVMKDHPDQVKALYGSVEQLLQTLAEKEQQVGSLRQEREAIEAQLKEHQSKTASLTKDQTEQIVRTLKSVYSKMLNHTLGDEPAAALQKALADPQVTAALHPMVVCASKWDEYAAHQGAAAAHNELAAMKDRVAKLSGALGQYAAMGGQQAAPPQPQAVSVAASAGVVPVWSSPPFGGLAAAAAAAPPPAAPMVAVEASAPSDWRTSYPALAGLKSYSDSAHSMRVAASDFSRNVAAPKQ